MRLVVCPLPSKRPWPNPIAPMGTHGQRRVVEPARLLPADWLIARVCEAFGCAHQPHLTMPELAA